MESLPQESKDFIWLWGQRSLGKSLPAYYPQVYSRSALAPEGSEGHTQHFNGVISWRTLKFGKTLFGNEVFLKETGWFQTRLLIPFATVMRHTDKGTVLIMINICCLWTFFTVPGSSALIEVADILMSPFSGWQFLFPTGWEQCSSRYLCVRVCPRAAPWCWPGPWAACESLCVWQGQEGMVITETQDIKAFRIRVAFKDTKLVGFVCACKHINHEVQRDNSVSPRFGFLEFCGKFCFNKSVL